MDLNDLGLDFGKNLLLSGGADGADLHFGANSGLAGHGVIHWSFEGHRTKAPEIEVVRLTKEQLESVDDLLFEANQTLKRHVPINKPWIANLLRRNVYQVRWANSVYAVGMWDGPDKVKGGTAWAVELYKNRFKDGYQNCRLFFFDQELCQWWQWLGSWQKINKPPKPTGVYAGIGTRELNTAGKDAIRDLFTDSPYKIITKVPQINDVIYLPSTKVEGFGLDETSGGWSTVRRVTTVKDDLHFISVSELDQEWCWERDLKLNQIQLRLQFGLIQAHFKPNFKKSDNQKLEKYRLPPNLID